MMPAFAPWYEAGSSFSPLIVRQVIPINLTARRITRQRQPMKLDRRENLMGGDGEVSTDSFPNLSNFL
jgi:hypothetical protein